MADLSFLAGSEKPFAILGLGMSGKAVADAMIDAGIAYHAWVDDAQTRQQLSGRYAFHDFTDDLSGYQGLIPAPGIKPSHPVIRKAAEQHIPILSDIDLLFLSAQDARYVGITGTNGKSTTTALVGHILKEAGINVAIGGNIGVAACSLSSLDKAGIYVLELSSFQLEITTHARFDVAALLNITPDHLDWHGSLEHYIASKTKIFRPRENNPQTSILAVDNADAKSIADRLEKEGRSVTRVTADDAPVADHAFLKGRHNRENMAVAFAVCRALGLEDREIIRHIASFEGLAHRQKMVARLGHIVFVNDSKGTNVDSTARALDSYDDLYWIVGGVATADEINGLEAYHAKIRHAFLIGQSSDRYAEILEGRVPYTKSGTMENAVAQAYAQANEKGRGTILLSPASKSFDQYANFEERGTHFETLVRNLVKKADA